MGWKEIQESGGGGENAAFLSLKDGDVKKVHIIDDEPVSFKSVFFNSINKGAVIDPDNNPLKGMKGFDVKTRHAINVYDYDDQKVKVLAGSNAMFNQLKAIYDEYEGFETIDLKITRSGTGLDTKYSIVPAAKCRWDKKLLKGLELNDLSIIFAPTDEETLQAYVEGRDVVKNKKVDDDDDEEVDALATEDEEEDDAEVDLGEDDDDEEKEEPEVIEEDFLPEDDDDEVPAPKPKKAVAEKPLSRNELVMKIKAEIKQKARYKKSPELWKSDVQRFGGKDKQSMSQLGTEALTKLYKYVQSVK